MRGGEYVLDRLAQLFGPTDLHVMVRNSDQVHTQAIDRCRILTSPLQRLPWASGRLRRWYLPLYPWAVKRVHIDPAFDLLFSTSSAMIKSISPPRRSDGSMMPHLCYCHTPARYLWEQVGDYKTPTLSGRMRSTALRLAGPYLRSFDRNTADHVTQFIANSHHTAKRIERVYSRQSTVIHPPVDTRRFSPDPSINREDCFITAGAFEPYKKTDLIINAAIRTGIRLRVIGTGSETSRLQQIAAGHSNIEILGYVSSDRLLQLFQTARGFLFAAQEDFGMTPVEAMATGCPVIAYAHGGAEDWMQTPQCGITFSEQSVDSLCDAIKRFQSDNALFTTDNCRVNALRFSPDRFDTEVLKVVRETI